MFKTRISRSLLFGTIEVRSQRRKTQFAHTWQPSLYVPPVIKPGYKEILASSFDQLDVSSDNAG